MNHNNFVFCLLNIRSLNNKVTDLMEYVIDKNIDFMFVTETWLSGTSLDNPIISEINKYDYKIHHVWRENRRGGGIAVLTKYRNLMKTNKSNNISYESFEYLEFSLNIKRELKICIIYRSPTSSIKEFLEDFTYYLNQVTDLNDNFIIMGDFNIHYDNKSNKYSKQFIDILEVFDLKNHINEPTHNKGHTLDLIITRQSYSGISNVRLDNYNTFSDHCAISFDMNNVEKSKVNKERKLVKDFSNVNYVIFSKDLKLKLDQLKHTEDINQLIPQYKEIIEDTIKENVPLKYKLCKNVLKWFDTEVRTARKVRRQMERKYIKQKDKSSFEEYTIARNNVTNLIMEKKKQYFNNLLDKNKNNTQILYNVFNNLMNVDNQTFESKGDKEFADLYAEFLTSKIEKIRNYLEENSKEDKCEVTSCNVFMKETFEIKEITELDVKKIFEQLKFKSCVLDPMPTKLIRNKNIHDVILPFLVQIINSSIRTQTFPDTEKLAIVTPVPKSRKAHRNEPNTFRPVSNLSFISKLIEKIVETQLSEYLESHKILSKFQSAYRKFYSTETAILKIHNDILNSLDKNECTIAIYLDLSAAFDTLDHVKIIDRLKQIGLGYRSLLWFQNYLRNRQYKVKVNDETSTVHNLKYGVPQGSILGPILFVIYINELFDILDSNNIQYHAYADDLQLYTSTNVEKFSESKIHLENVVQKCITWFRSNKLMINESKTEYIIYGKANLLSKIKCKSFNVGNVLIEPKEKVKNIGFINDAYYKMQHQIDNIFKNCKFQLYRLGKIRKFLNCNSTRILVNAFVISRLDFQNSLLYGLPMRKLNRLQMIINSSVRLIFKLRKRTHITEYIKKLGWLNIQNRIIYKIIIIIKKVLIHKSPTYLYEMLHIKNTYECKNLRNNDNKLAHIHSSNSISDGTLPVASQKLYNNLPTELRKMSNLFNFKKQLHKYLLT